MRRAAAVAGHDAVRWLTLHLGLLAGLVLACSAAAFLYCGPAVVWALAGPSTVPPAVPPTAAAPSDGWTPEPPAARFSCARPIFVLHNPAGAPADVEQDVQRSVAAVAEATGRLIRYGGTTDARRGLDVTRPDAPAVVISWVADVADLDGASSPTTIAVGSSSRQDDRLVAGDVELAADAVPPTGSGPGELEVVLRHELAHAVGVDQHSTDPEDVLYPYLLTAKDPTWGPGDLAALAAVGCPIT